MDNESPTEANEATDKPFLPPGCLKGCIAPAIVFLIAAAAIGAILGSMRDVGEPIMLRGEAVISRPSRYGIDPSNCKGDGNSVLVNAVSNGAEVIRLDTGTRQSDGSCVFTFAVEVPTADRYVFSMPGTNAREYSFRRTLIDTNGPTGVELEVTLRW